MEKEWLTSTAFMEDHILAKVPEAWLMGLPSTEQLVGWNGSLGLKGV